MSMHKIFFGTIVFFSLAFLAGCGGGGSGSSGAAGAAGAAGADGATGATGSIAVPSADANLAIATGAGVDSNLVLGRVEKALTVGGLDNLTTSRIKYYGYLGTSSTTKSEVVTALQIVPSAGSTALWPLFNDGTATDDNITITGLDLDLGDGDGSITHLIICPGNEAGDATSCASKALNDRGYGVRVVNALDNVTRVFVNQGATQSFSLVTADGVDLAGANGSSGLTEDNTTASQVITDTKSDLATAIPTLGTASTIMSETVFSAIMDNVLHGSALYTLSAKDNGTLTACTTSGCSTSTSRILNNTAVDTHIVLDSDGTNMIGILDNATATNSVGTLPATSTDNFSSIHVFNLTTPGTPVQVGSTIVRDDNSTSGSGVGPIGQFCGAVGGGQVVVFADNQSADNSLGQFYSTGIDNATAWELTAASRVLDNATAGVNCSMTYAGITGVTRQFYMIVDNGTTGKLFSITDNTTTAGTGIGTPALTIAVAGSVAVTPTATSIDADGNGIPYFALDIATNGATLYRGVAAEVLGAAVSGVFDAIDVKVSSDDKKAAIAGFSTDGGALPAVRVWYNE